MPALAIALFPLIAICAIAFLHVQSYRAKNLIIDRYPQAYLEAERKSWTAGMGFYRLMFGRFGFGGRYKDLADPELDRIVRNLKLAYLAFPVAVLAMMISIAVTAPN